MGLPVLYLWNGAPVAVAGGVLSGVEGDAVGECAGRKR